MKSNQSSSQSSSRESLALKEQLLRNAFELHGYSSLSIQPSLSSTSDLISSPGQEQEHDTNHLRNHRHRHRRSQSSSISLSEMSQETEMEMETEMEKDQENKKKNKLAMFVIYLSLHKSYIAIQRKQLV